jgi:hypothetical protein
VLTHEGVHAILPLGRLGTGVSKCSSIFRFLREYPAYLAQYRVYARAGEAALFSEAIGGQSLARFVLHETGGGVVRFTAEGAVYGTAGYGFYKGVNSTYEFIKD